MVRFAQAFVSGVVISQGIFYALQREIEETASAGI
jgi:hypothetical protein